MGLRLNTNVATITAQRFLDKNSRQVERSLQALSSGLKVRSPKDDAAGFVIGERLKGQISGTEQAKSNAQAAMSLIQTAEGGLNEQNNILVRLRELAVNSASDTIGDKEREFLNTEFGQLVEEFDRIAKSTRYGSKQLLNGNGEDFTFHVGAFNGPENTIKFKLSADTQAGAVGINGLGVADQGDALDSLEQIDDAVLKVTEVRAKLGAAQSRFQYTIDNLDSQRESLYSAKSLISDVDVAEEVSRLHSAQILQEAGTMVLAQANQTSPNVLRLLGG